jgi:hypothetical protein
MSRTLYEKGPCSCCREFAVRRLMECNAVTEDLRVECAYDCNVKVRRLVKE